MENKKIKNGIEEIRSIKMTSEEKENILQNVLGFSVSPIKPIRSPYSFVSIFQRNHFAFYGVLSCLIIFLGSGNMLLASQKSVPGSVLYPLKVRVLEPLNYALKLSPEDKAQYEISLVKERIAETKTLASLGKLDAYTEKQVNDLIVNHKIAFDNAISEIKNDESSEQKFGVTTNFENQFQNEIEEHTQVLALATEQINETNEENNDSQNEVVAMINRERISVSPTPENTETNTREMSKNTKSTEPVNAPDPTYMGTSSVNPLAIGTVPMTTNNKDSQKYVDIVLPLFTNWIEQLSKERGDVLNYQINQIDFVASKENAPLGENSWFNPWDSNDAFIVMVNYSVQTTEEGKNNYWLAGNGRDSENGWVLNKSLFVTIDKENEMYTIKNIGTGP